MKVSITRTKSSKLLYITKSTRVGNKVTTSTVKRLGKVDDLMKSHNLNSEQEVIDWAKNLAKQMTEKKQSGSSTIVLNQQCQIELDDRRLFHGGYLFLQDILYDMKFKNIIRNINGRYLYEYNMEAILSDLIFARILEPCSKRASLEVCKGFLEPPKYELHDIYRALSVLAKEDDYIQSELYKNSNFVVERNNKVLYYDCTNYFFEIEDEDDFRKYGKEKNHRPNPIVVNFQKKFH